MWALAADTTTAKLSSAASVALPSCQNRTARTTIALSSAVFLPAGDRNVPAGEGGPAQRDSGAWRAADTVVSSVGFVLADGLRHGLGPWVLESWITREPNSRVVQAASALGRAAGQSNGPGVSSWSSVRVRIAGGTTYVIRLPEESPSSTGQGAG